MKDLCVFVNSVKEIVGEDIILYDRILAEVYCQDMIDAIKECSPNINMIYGIDYGISTFFPDVKNKINPDELVKNDISFVSYSTSMESMFLIQYSKT